ncbi:MAG: DUF5667 domain-containing protein [Patescibacteria group bacterium]
MNTRHNRGFAPIVPAVIIGLVALMGGTVATAQISLPGSPLYGIKTATERARLAIALSDENKAKTHLSIAADKLRELEELSDKNASLETIEKVEASFEENQSKAKGYIGSREKEVDAPKLSQKLDDNSVKNEEVLTLVHDKAPEQAKPAFKNILERVKGNHKETTGSKDNK